MEGVSIQDIANGILAIIIGLLGYFGIKGGVKKGEDASAPRKDASTFEVAGALVDNRAVEKLSGEVAGQSLAITAQAVAIKEQTEAIREQTRAIRDLHGDLSEIADISRSITDLGTQIARMK